MAQGAKTLEASDPGMSNVIQKVANALLPFNKNPLLAN